MATIRIPFADTQIATPSPGAGQVRANLQPSMRDGRAGQMPGELGQRSIAAAMIDPAAAAAPGRAAFASAREGGQAALQAGAALDRMAKAEQDLSDQTELTRRGVEAQRRTAELQEQFDTRSFSSSDEARRAFREQSSQIVRELGEGLSGRVQTLWEARSEEIIFAREFNVGQAARTRIHQAAIATTTEGNRALANQAALSRNPVERATLMEQAEGAINSLVTAGAINEIAAGRLRTGFRQDVQTADVTRLMAENPTAAIARLNDLGRDGTPDLDADRRAALINQALNRRDTMAARAEAVAARNERRIERAIGEFDAMLANGIVPAERAEAVLSMARGTPFEAGVRQRIEDGRAVAEFRLANPERQAAMLAAVDGRTRAGTATDRDLAQAQRLQQVAEQQRRGYAQDGWMQGVRDGLIERSEMPAPLNLGDPSTIVARFELSDRLTAARRQAVPVFSAAEVQEINRQFVAAQNNPALVAQITASINAIPDERIRAATYRQLEAARGDAGRMEQGTLTIIGRAAAGSPAQQRAAVQMTQAVTTDRSERVRAIGEGPALRSAMDTAMASPEMQAIQATARLGRTQEVEFNAQLGIVRDLAAQHMAAGLQPDEAVRLARQTVFADRVTINRPGLAQVQYDAGLNLGAPDAVERGLRTMRDGFAARIPIDPGLGQEAVSRNRDLLRLAGQAEWVTVAPGRFGLVATGDYGQRVVLMEATADQVRASTQGVTTQRAQEAAPRPVGQRRTGQMRPAPVEGMDAPTATPETVRPMVQ